MRKRLFSRSALAAILALSVFTAGAPRSAGAEAPQAGKKALFLHYRWHADGAITLVGKKELPARLKPSRAAANRTKPDGRIPAGFPRGSGMAGGETVLTYALLSAGGDTLSEQAIPDPSLLRVEIQEPGENQLRSHAAKRDSGDIFLRIGEPEARAIRFFKWHTLAPAGALPKAAATKTLIAEFPLP